MKARWLSIPAAALFIISAGHAWTEEELTGEALARQSGCLECHSVEEKIVGPAYRDVAERYREVEHDRLRAALIEKVKNGGKGNWTEITRGVPMPPHSPRLTDAEIELLVDWVLSL
jgi:cytochrome c551/c552